MGISFSKRCDCSTSTNALSNPHMIFPYKLMFEDKDAYSERNHLGHVLLRETFNGNFSSNIRDILLCPDTKVLDVGCGSGFWLMEMAADYQKPRYVGIDMIPFFPKSTFPSNIKFLQHNFLEGLPYDDNTFDFVHMQYLSFDFTELQWETFVYQELARVLKPGGWLEICDPDPEFANCGPLTKKLNSAVHGGLKSRNINPYIIQRYHSLIKSIPSFSSSTVHHEQRNFPLCSRTSNVGELAGLHTKERCRCVLKGPIRHHMKIKKKDVDLTTEKIAREFELHNTSFDIHKFYVQKGI